MGIAFPATAEVEGYTAEKAKGHLIELAGGAVWNIDITMGLKTLYVTTAKAENLERLAGSLFAINVEVPGMAENVFSLG